MEKIKKRLIGVEDIAFDASGNGEKDSYVLSDGKNIDVKRLNASYIPLTAELREKLTGAGNVEDGLEYVNKKISGFTILDTMTEDVEIVIDSEDTAEVIQNKIDEQKKNLGGHVLTFVFPGSLSMLITQTLVFENFYNGTLIICCNDEEGRTTLNDLSADSESIIRIVRCAALIQIRNLYFQHNFTQYAISAYASPAVDIANCDFEGNEGSYALYLAVSSARLEGCSFLRDKVVLSQDELLQEVFRFVEQNYLKLSGGTVTGGIYFGEGTGNSTNIFSLDNRIIITGGSSYTNGGNLRVYGDGYNHDGSTKMAGGFSLIVTQGGKNAHVLTGTRDGLAFDEKDITLGYPNYAGAVAVGSTSSYEAPADGWVCIRNQQNDKYTIVTVNGVNAGGGGGSSQDHTSFFLPVKMGDIVKTYSTTLNDGNPTAVATNFVFYPNR